MNILTAPSSVNPDIPELTLYWLSGCGECGKIEEDCDCDIIAECFMLVYNCPDCCNVVRAVDWTEHHYNCRGWD